MRFSIKPGDQTNETESPNMVNKRITGEYPYRSVSSINCTLPLGVLLYIKLASCIFSAHIFLRTPPDGCFWCTLSSCVWKWVILHVVKTKWEAKYFHENFHDALERGVVAEIIISFYFHRLTPSMNSLIYIYTLYKPPADDLSCDHTSSYYHCPKEFVVLPHDRPLFLTLKVPPTRAGFPLGQGSQGIC